MILLESLEFFSVNVFYVVCVKNDVDAQVSADILNSSASLLRMDLNFSNISVNDISKNGSYIFHENDEEKCCRRCSNVL